MISAQIFHKAQRNRTAWKQFTTKPNHRQPSLINNKMFEVIDTGISRMLWYQHNEDHATKICIH